MAKKKKLTVKQKRMRAPVVPGSSTTYGDVRRESKAAAKLQYGPALRAVGQRQENITNWFDQYKADIAKSNQAQQGVYTGATQGIRDTASASAAQAAAQQRQLAEEAQKDAASRGATYSGTPTQQGQAGTDLRHILADSFAAAIAAQGSAYAANKEGQANVGSAAQLSERLRAQKDREGLVTDRAAYRTKYAADARDAAAKGVLEQAVFGLKAQTQADTVADRRAARRVSRKNNREDNATSVQNTQIRTDAAAEKDRRQATAKQREHVVTVREKSGKGVSRITDIIDRWHTLGDMMVGDKSQPKKKDGTYPTRKPSPNEIRSKLQDEGFTGEELDLAVKVNAHQPLTPADIRAAHRLGIRVPRSWIHPARGGAQAYSKGAGRPD